jgi:hypothetical protein
VGDCSEFNFCFRRGTCERGLCECQYGFRGLSCEQKLRCEFFNETTGTYDTRGLTQVPPSSGEPDGFLHCETTHLTDFGGVSVPLSTDELLADMSDVTFNTFTMDDAVRLDLT